tara:strand:+ start:7429 stop:8448 length:1020 start_codon:yes stop_codon:yes gene_type:complete
MEQSTAREMLEKIIEKQANPKPDSNLARLQQLIDAKEDATLNAPILNPETMENHVDTKFSSGLIDDLTGSKIASRITPEKMPEQKVQEAIQNRLRIASQGPKTNLNTMLRVVDQANKTKRAADVNNRLDLKEKNKATQDLSKSYQKSRKELTEFNRGVSDIEQAMTTGNIAEIQNKMSNFARTIGGEKGALSEGDVQRVFSDNVFTLWGKAKNFFTGETDAKVTEPQLQLLRKIIARAKKLGQEAFESDFENIRSNALAALPHHTGLRGLGEEGVNKFHENAMRDLNFKRKGFATPQIAEKNERKEVPKTSTTSSPKAQPVSFKNENEEYEYLMNKYRR